MERKITKQDVARKISSYLNRTITLEQMVDWAEEMICEAEYEEGDFELIKEVLSRLGLADVKEFGLSWDDCYNFLSRLGYQVRVFLFYKTDKKSPGRDSNPRSPPYQGGAFPLCYQGTNFFTFLFLCLFYFCA